MGIGQAIELDDAGDIKRSKTAAGYAFSRVDGLQEVAQAIAIRLRTRKGEDNITPDNGFPARDALGLFHEDFLRALVRATASEEPRVKSIGDISVELERDKRVAKVVVPVTLRDGSTITIEEAFGI